MTVHFIGAGPGAPDLITLRGRALIEAAPLVLYAGSLVPPEVVQWAAGRVVDTASMTLDDIIAEMVAAHRKGHDTARVHSGDPALYGAIAEQIRRLRAEDIPITITPGVPAYAAAAAVLQCELTLPGVTQTVILTRTAMKASPMPPGEALEDLRAGNATLAIHLSIRNIRAVQRSLIPALGGDCPVAVVYRATWPDQKIIHGTLTDIHEKIRREKITRTALIMVGPALEQDAFTDSRLYDPDHVHLLRPTRRKSTPSPPQRR